MSEHTDAVDDESRDAATDQPEEKTVPPDTPRERSLEDRVKGLENRLKLAAVVISIVALAAPVASATAAWFSLSTAERALTLAQYSSSVSGADLVANSYVQLAGGCDPKDPNSSLKAIVTVVNAGHIAGRISTIGILYFDKQHPELSNVGLKNLDSDAGSMASSKEQVLIGPQDGADIQLPIDCAWLARHNLHPEAAVDELGKGVEDGRLVLTVWFTTTLGGNEGTHVDWIGKVT